MGTLMWLIVIGSAAFVYWDTTKNKIGKIPGEKSLTNASPLIWAIGILFVWIVAFPLYLYKRKELIQKAQENHVEAPEKQKKVVLGVLCGLAVLVIIAGFFGEGGMVGMVKNGTLNAYPDLTIGELLDKSLDDLEWEEQKSKGGIGFVTANGTIVEDDATQMVTVKFKLIEKTGALYPMAIYLDGEELPEYMMERFFTRMYARHRPKSKPAKLSTEDADIVAKANIKNAYVSAQAYFTDYLDGIVTLPILEQNYTRDKGVTLEVLDGGMTSLSMRSYHSDGDMAYHINALGDITESSK